MGVLAKEKLSTFFRPIICDALGIIGVRNPEKFAKLLSNSLVSIDEAKNLVRSLAKNDKCSSCVHYNVCADRKAISKIGVEIGVVRCEHHKEAT